MLQDRRLNGPAFPASALGFRRSTRRRPGIEGTPRSTHGEGDVARTIHRRERPFTCNSCGGKGLRTSSLATDDFSRLSFSPTTAFLRGENLAQAAGPSSALAPWQPRPLAAHDEVLDTRAISSFISRGFAAPPRDESG